MMDLSLYFQPVDFPDDGSLTPHTFGYHIRKEKEIRTGKKPTRVAIFGVPATNLPGNRGKALAPDEIRKHLYRFALPEISGGIIDLGNLKPGKKREDVQYALRDVVEYLSDNKIMAVILGGSQELSIGISRAFRDDRRFTLTIVDAGVDVKTTREATHAGNFISRIWRENPSLFHLQMIGLQSHLVSPFILQSLREKSYDFLRMGDLRDNFSAVEPLLRQTTFLSFDLSALRQSEVKTGGITSSSGLTAEEACRLAHYAGLGCNLKVFGIFELNPELDPDGKGSNLTAQMIWYFLDALAHSVPVDPMKDPAGFNRYFAHIGGHEIVFFQHPSTDRWWMEVEMEGFETLIVPCREMDYLIAMKDEIPDLWWKYARKTEKYSKY